MADNVQLNSGTGGAIAAADEVTYSGDTTKVQLVRLVHVAGAEGAKTLTEVVGTAGTPGTAVVTVQGVASGTVVPVSDGGGTLTVDGTVTANLAAGTNNIGDVDVLSIAAGDNNIGNVDIVTVPAPLSTTGGGTEAAALRVTIATDSTGVLSVDDNGGTLTVDGTVTANLAAGTNNIGDVDVLSIAAGDNNIGNVDIVTMPGVAGAAAHDAAVSGNPVLVGAHAETSEDTAPANRASADGDAVRIAADRDGALYAHPHGPQVWSYHVNGSAALTDAVVHAAPGAGLSLYVTDVVISTGAATALNAFFEEGTTTVLGPFYLEAVAGRGLVIQFRTPKKITANTALTVTTSAAIAHAVDVTGFTAP